MAYVYGTVGNDILDGLDTENDYIYGYEGDDIINGLGGDDYIDPGTGVDTVDGGDGNDLLNLNLYTYDDLTDISVTYTDLSNGIVSNGTTFKNIEAVNITTGNGNDTVNISAAPGHSNYYYYYYNYVYTYGGNDTVTSGESRDYIVTDEGNDSVNSGGGDDIVYGGNGNNTINTGEGNDYISVGTGASVIDGGAGVDRLSLNFYNSDNPVVVTLKSTANGISTGTGSANFRNIEQVEIIGGRDDDKINIGVLNSSASGDYNYLQGLEGNDNFTGSAFRDSIGGGTGNDRVQAGAGDDYVYGDTGSDNVDGGAGNDILYGQSENDTLAGGAGNDSLFGGSESDTLTGVNAKSGFGVGEVDYLYGESGKDFFVMGNSTKVYYNDGNVNTDGAADYAYITDFSVAQRDVIRLRGTAADYELVDAAAFGSSGTAVAYKTGQTTSELVAIVGSVGFGSTPSFTLNSQSFSYIAAV